MEFFQYLIQIGVVYLFVIYGFKFIINFPFLFLLVSFGNDKKVIYWAMLPIHVLETYLLVALTAKVSLIAKSGLSTSLVSGLYITIGMVVLYMTLVSATKDRRKRIHQQDARLTDWTVVRYAERSDRLIMLGSFVLYCLSMVVPLLSTNLLIDSILDLINQVTRMSVVGIIFKGLGIVNLTGIFMLGFSSAPKNI